MKEISNHKEFIEWLTKSDNIYEKKHFDRSYYQPSSNMLFLKGLVLTNLSIRDRNFECTEFKNCRFENCDFTTSIISSCTLEKCHFKGCRFVWSKFLDVDLFTCKFKECIITGLELCDAVFRETEFINCTEILDLAIRGSRERFVSFHNCYLHHLDIEPIGEQNSEKIDFIECLIKESSFDRVDFSESNFNNCILSLNQFSSCILSKSTFIGKNQTPGNEFNLIDIRTILNSTPQDTALLVNLFGIHNSEIKDYLIGLTSKIEFQSIFISYSFNDKEFAKIINEELRRRGILTFQWEKDSPGGKSLKKIMSTEVKAKDRILFIASSNSLKSEACQFELSEGRKKQNQTWQDVFFPIHIDNFLFEVEKEQIRPIEKQEEYWENIEELRRVNSLSFQKYVNSNTMNDIGFEKQIFKLIKGLRKE